MSESAPNPKTGADTIREKVSQPLKSWVGGGIASHHATRTKVKTMTIPERFSGTNASIVLIQSLVNQ